MHSSMLFHFDGIASAHAYSRKEVVKGHRVIYNITSILQFLIACFIGLAACALVIYVVAEMRKCKREITNLKERLYNLESASSSVGRISSPASNVPLGGEADHGRPSASVGVSAPASVASAATLTSSTTMPTDIRTPATSVSAPAGAPVPPVGAPLSVPAAAPTLGTFATSVPSPANSPAALSASAGVATSTERISAQTDNSLEGAFGRNVIGLAAVILVFLGLIFLGILVIPTLENIVRCAAMWLISLVLVLAGLLTTRRRQNTFSVSLLGGGLGAVFISVLITHVYFHYLGEIPAFGLLLAWMAACMALIRRLDSIVLSVIVHVGMVVSVCFAYAIGFNETRLPLVVTYQMLACILVVVGDVFCMKKTYRSGLLTSLVLILIASLFMYDYFRMGFIGFGGPPLTTPVVVVFFLQFIGASVLLLLFVQALPQKGEARHTIATVSYVIGKLVWFGVLLVDVWAVVRQLSLQTSGLVNNAGFYGTVADRLVMIAEAQATVAGLICLAVGIALILWLTPKGVVDRATSRLPLCLLGFMAAFLLVLRYALPHLSLLAIPNLSYIVLVATFFYILAYAKRDTAFAMTGDILWGLDVLLMIAFGYGKLVDRAGLIAAFVYVVLLMAIAFLSWCGRCKKAAVPSVLQVSGIRPRILICLVVAEISTQVIVAATAFRYTQVVVASILAVLLVGMYILQARDRKMVSGTFWIGAAVNELVVSMLIAFWVLRENGSSLLYGENPLMAYTPALLVLLVLVGLRLWDFYLDTPRPAAVLQVSEGITLSLLGWALVRCFTILLDAAFVESIVVMATALICIAVGFKARLKPLRLYGLTLAIICVLKLVLVDAAVLEPLARVASFIIGGAICFAISAIYSYVERRMKQQGNVGPNDEIAREKLSRR